MPSLEPPEHSGTHRPYPVDGSFAALLDWHLDAGTRAKGDCKPWDNVEFHIAVRAEGCATATENLGRLVRMWRTGERRTSDFISIARALFKEDDETHRVWRQELRIAYDKPILPSPVPPAPVYFLGRDEDVDLIVDAVTITQGPHSILVQGGPGIGKTALTKAVGNHSKIVGRFGTANRWFVELETADTAAAMQDAITQALGVDPKGGFQAALKRLRRAPGLLVLDNLETPWEPLAERPATEAVLAALAAVPNVVLLASFRGRDRVANIAWNLVHHVTQLTPFFATKLFCQIANWDRSEDSDLPHLVQALGGVPLAIELVAVHALGEDSIAPLWKQWIKIGVELAKHPEYLEGRLTSVPHSIELSLASKRMTPNAKRLFCLLGQLPAGLAEEDRDALLGDDGFKAEGILQRIGLAVDHAGRLDLLPPIRDHAARHHKPSVADAAAWPTHYLDLTKRLGSAIGTITGEGAVARLVPEFANIEAAIRAALRAGRRSEIMAAMVGFQRLTTIAVLSAPILIDLAEACRSDGDVINQASCLHIFGETALARADYESARRAYEEALLLYRKVGEVLGEANCIFSLGDVLSRINYESARQAYEEARLLYRKIGEVLGEANCVLGLGDIAFGSADYEVAQRAYEEARLLYRKMGQVLNEASCNQGLGDIALKRADYEGARRAYEEVLALYRRSGAVNGEAQCLSYLGDVALALLDYESARKAYEEALPLYRQIGHAPGEAACLERLEALRRS